MGRVAFLFPAFPVFHQTFVLGEVLGLRRNGVQPKLYSLHRPSRQQQPEGRDIAREVTFLPRLVSVAVLRANWRFLRDNARRYWQLYVKVAQAWRSGAVAPPASAEDDGEWKLSLYDRGRGWFNTQPHLYLLKSLLLVPTAVHLAEELRAKEITHLHVHWASYPATAAYVVHLISGLPFSVSAHAYDIYMVSRMLPTKLRAARFVVTCAKANARYLTELAGPELDGKIFVNYHGVDISRFAPGAAPRSTEALSIVSCGQLERYKGMHVLINACAELTRQGVALECWIVGEGPERSRLQGQIERLGLTARVHLLGRRPHTELAELLKKADVFVLASQLGCKFRRRDVIANVIVEAMATGIPVVASRVPGVEELVEDRATGYLVEPNRADQLAAAIRKFIDHPADRVRFGTAGRRRVLQDFDSSKNVRTLAGLFTALLTHDVEHRPVRSASSLSMAGCAILSAEQ
jgi:glycosyltransferase involved in cell wall biosynthesis